MACNEGLWQIYAHKVNEADHDEDVDEDDDDDDDDYLFVFLASGTTLLKVLSVLLTSMLMMITVSVMKIYNKHT